MMKNWEVKTLGDVLQKTETINPTQKPNEEFIYIDVSSVNNETFSVENTTVLKGKDAPSRARKFIKTGDVIFATVRPTLRRIAIIPEEYDGQICSTGYFVLRAKEFINNKFLFYYLLTSSFNERMEKLQKGASYPAVTDTEVREQIISYPPLPEQQRLVAILDEVFAALATAKENAAKNLQNARELFESVLQGVFANRGVGWEERKLGEVCDVIAGQSPEGKYYNNTGDGLPFYQGKKDFTAKFIGKPTTWTTKVTKEAQPDDILISVRAPVGPINFATDRICIGRGLAAIRAGKNIIPDYLFCYLSSMQDVISGREGAVFASINKSDIENLEIPLPPLPEQQRLVTKLDALSAETKKLEAIYQQKLANLEELKQSVLRKAFRGEI